MARVYSTTMDLGLLEGSRDYANERGRYECVALVQKITGIPLTATWKKGKKVLDCSPGEIAKGTVIATFDENGRYPENEKHAAFYESHDPGGINVVDQWHSQGMAKRRKIRMKNLASRDVNDAQWYYIVETEA